MAWKQEKTDTGIDYVWDGVELGIAPSPTKGTANLQNVNIATESGQVMASFDRTNQAQLAIAAGTLVPDGATLLDVTAPVPLKAGMWIKVTASTVSSITAATNPTTVAIDYLMVGGGGGGAGSDNATEAGGGGGAGQFLTASTTVSATSYAITVGKGGAGGNIGGTAGASGTSSIIATVATAYPGAGGGDAGSAGGNATTGGSGGGGGSNSGAAGTGATGGNNGGAGDAGGSGGGGGSGSAGDSAAFSNGGDGGDGTTSSFTGISSGYSGGGGGGSENDNGGSGSIDDFGGGEGGGLNTAGENATANTGSGGGGAGGGGTGFVGGNGGSGIVAIKYLTGSAFATGGEVTKVGDYTIHIFRTDGIFTVLQINPGGWYYVSYSNAAGTEIKLSAEFDPTGANALTHGTTGSITFDTVATPNQGVAKTTEKYTTASSTEYRYYIVDANSYLWVFDSLIYNTYGTQWMLSNPFNYSTLRLTGLGVLNGMLLAVGSKQVYGKPTVNLGDSWNPLINVYLNEPFPTHNNFAIVGNQGKMYYCDGNYIGEIFATTSLVTSIANIQSISKYTSTSTTGTISEIVSGSLPYDPGGVRIPVVLFTDVYGTIPTAINANEVYYIAYTPDAQTFKVYSSLTSTTELDITTGASGNQYFTTFWPYGTMSGYGGTEPLIQFTAQRVNLPSNETAQTMVEVGNTVLIGGLTNTVYPWNQIDATPGDFIALPEANVKVMVNVNNIAYIFAGNKGNIYITNGSVASLALKVPDYCAGVPGTPISYIEPVFNWGDADYVRGRVYFSILDQTSAKAGNCGGVWSFVPAQNVDPSQDIGMALRLENQNSYGTYSGVANLIIASLEQDVTSPQYWASWQSSYSAGTSTFGIDFTATTPVTHYEVETDLLPTGTFLNQETFQQLEYKLTTPLLTGDSIALYYRLNGTAAWTACDTIIEETTNRISGYVKANFQKSQWTQFRAVITTPGTTASSFARLTQLRLR